MCVGGAWGEQDGLGRGGAGEEEKEEVSEQEAQLLIYVQQWMKAAAARRPGAATTALKLKSISSLGCESLFSALHFPCRHNITRHEKNTGQNKA